ncbi:MAG: AEC family transporter [Lachnospiraceae bacterium]|nr:AEC family transporter [Lachnospiraceae bacterium]
MENFIFSINSTMPIFLVILLGYVLKMKKFLTEEFADMANKFCFNIALPLMLYQDISKTNVREEMDIRFFLFCLIVTIIMFMLVWCIAKLFVKDKTMVGAFAQAGARGSAAILGVAFVENICGDIGMTALMIVASVPFFNMLSVIILVCEAPSKSNENINKIKSSIINIAKNPIIIGIVLGLIASLVELRLPVIIDRSFDYVGRTATPIALIAIGAGFNVKEAIARLKPAIGASFIKLIGLPMLFLPIAVKMGFRDAEMVSILVMLAAPTTVSSYVMAKSMNNDHVLASNVIVLTTLLASVTLTAWVFILRTLGVI